MMRMMMSTCAGVDEGEVQSGENGVSAHSRLSRVRCYANAGTYLVRVRQGQDLAAGF